MQRFNGLIVAFIVTWSVKGSTLVQCAANQKPEPALGFCVSAVNVPESREFPERGPAHGFIKELKAFKNDSIKITDVHLYSEQGAE